MTPNSARLPRTTRGSGDPAMTFSQGGSPTSRVSVYEVDPASGTATSVGSTTMPRDQVPPIVPGGDPQQQNDQVIRMLDRFNELNAQRASPAPGATTTTPSR